MAARFVRDEEAAGSNPATPTEKFQVDGMIAKRGDHAIDHLLAIRWQDRTSARGVFTMSTQMPFRSACPARAEGAQRINPRQA